jgi:hypothetical protein
MKGIDVKAVGVATPAVLTADLAAGCSKYITSVVMMVRLESGVRVLGAAVGKKVNQPRAGMLPAGICR